MKKILTLLLLIPSLSWGIDYLKKNIPISKQEFNYLYGYELGKEITNDQLTENGLKTFDPQNPKDSNYPFTYLSRNTGNSSNDSDYRELKFKILNDDFDSVGVIVDANSIIKNIYLFKTIYKEDIRNQLSGILSLLNLKEIDGTSLTTCEEFKSTVLNAYRFKRGIKEDLKDFYEYSVSIESGVERQIVDIQSLNLLEDKKGNILESYCTYSPYSYKDERSISTYFVLSLSSSELLEYADYEDRDFDKENQTFEIDRGQFKNLLSIIFNLNTDGL